MKKEQQKTNRKGLKMVINTHLKAQQQFVFIYCKYACENVKFGTLIVII